MFRHLTPNPKVLLMKKVTSLKGFLQDTGSQLSSFHKVSMRARTSPAPGPGKSVPSPSTASPSPLLRGDRPHDRAPSERDSSLGPDPSRACFTLWPRRGGDVEQDTGRGWKWTRRPFRKQTSWPPWWGGRGKREGGAKRDSQLLASRAGRRSMSLTGTGRGAKRWGSNDSHVAFDMVRGYRTVSVRNRSPEAGAQERRLCWTKTAWPGVTEHVGRGHT